MCTGITRFSLSLGRQPSPTMPQDFLFVEARSRHNRHARVPRSARSLGHPGAHRRLPLDICDLGSGVLRGAVAACALAACPHNRQHSVPHSRSVGRPSGTRSVDEGRLRAASSGRQDPVRRAHGPGEEAPQAAHRMKWRGFRVRGLVGGAETSAANTKIPSMDCFFLIWNHTSRSTAPHGYFPRPQPPRIRNGDIIHGTVLLSSRLPGHEFALMAVTGD